MAIKKVKSAAKVFTSDLSELENIIIQTVDKIDSIVGASLGPGGRNVIIESELAGLPNTNTKDGVTIFRSLGSQNAYEHLLIEQIRDVAVKTVNEAGDGTTTSTVIASSLIKNLFDFCKKNPKYSPQKVTRVIAQVLKEEIIPFIDRNSIQIDENNKELLEKVATVSTNGDREMGKAVIKAFEEVGYGASSHVTIQELSGPSKYEVELIEGFPIEKGYEESIGKFHPAFINDQAHQRCVLDKPLFILFDGNITDMVQIQDVLNNIGQEYVQGNSNFKNVVLVAHKFNDQVLTSLAFNFSNPNTINVLPLATPMSQIINSQLHFLMDLSAFTGAKIFDMNNPISTAGSETLSDFGQNMEKIEVYRFRTTIVGDPDPLNIETRAEEIKTLSEQSESKIEKVLLEERLGKITNGIAKLKIFGSTNAELKEKADRAEDAVCSIRASINHGCLPGGGRILINIALFLLEKYSKDSKEEKKRLVKKSHIIRDVLVPSLYSPILRILSNAGYNNDEIEDIFVKLVKKQDLIFDVENGEFGDAFEMGIFDATLAVKQALLNSTSIASNIGTLGGIVAFPRDQELENQEFKDQMNFNRTLDNAQNLKNEANERP